MKIFEFHFNPGDNSSLAFDSFCQEPENIYERKMGGLFMLGELKAALPHNYRLPQKVADAIKKEFYSKFQRSPELALKESLKKGNEILGAELSKENTDWLGNLNFAIMSLKNYELRFTKTGGIKIFLLRGPHLIDIGQKLDSVEIEPYPLKIFSNIVSGKLGEGDLIIAVTEKIFPPLKQIIAEVGKIFPFDEKKLKDLIKAKEAELANFSGAMIIINVVKTAAQMRRPKIVFQKEAEKFSLIKFLSPVFKKLLSIPPLIRKTPNLVLHLKSLRIKLWPKKQPPPAPVEKEKTKPVSVKIKIKTSSHPKKPSPFVFLKKIKNKLNGLRKIRMPAWKIKIPSWKIRIPSFPIKTLIRRFKKTAFIFLLLILFLVFGFFLFR
jgi:hypothetical protein